MRKLIDSIETKLTFKLKSMTGFIRHTPNFHLMNSLKPQVINPPSSAVDGMVKIQA